MSSIKIIPGVGAGIAFGTRRSNMISKDLLGAPSDTYRLKNGIILDRYEYPNGKILNLMYSDGILISIGITGYGTSLFGNDFFRESKNLIIKFFKKYDPEDDLGDVLIKDLGLKFRIGLGTNRCYEIVVFNNKNKLLIDSSL